MHGKERFIILAFFISLLFSSALFVSPAHSFTLAIEQPVLGNAVNVSGTDYVLEPQTPGTKKITISVLCTLESRSDLPPQTVTIEYSLLKGGILVKGTHPRITVGNWNNTLSTSVKKAAITYEFPLPNTGPDQTEMETADDYTFGVEILTSPGPKDATGESQTFPYTVYSGNLYFNEVHTNLTALTPGGVCDTSNMTLDSTSTAVWDSGYGEFSLDVSGLCAASIASPNGYANDLVVSSGSVSGIGPVEGTTAGVDWTINVMALNPSGGTFSISTLMLPDNVKAYYPMGNQIWPRGLAGIVFTQSTSFTNSLESAALTFPTPLYFHSYGLPFYLAADGVSLSLSSSNTDGIVLTNPSPYYVHKDAFDSLYTDHKRSYFGFPSNDAMFREADTLASNTAHIDPGGIQARLGFHAKASDTAFPKARLQYPNFGIDIQDSRIKENSTLSGNNPVTLALKFDGNCPDGDCGEDLDTRSFIVSSDEGARFFTNGALAARFDSLDDLNFPDSSQFSWGGFNGTDATFFRDDNQKKGVWVIPGFIMPDTAASPGAEGVGRIGQTLLGSFTFNEPLSSTLPIEADALHRLNHSGDYSAHWGDGYFAGINMGPEILNGPYSSSQTIEAGVGTILSEELFVRFNGNSDFSAMPDRQATKYNLRPGGLTGVFNTDFSSSSGGDINIYNYAINFSRFSFRQTLNTLSPQTFIDGELTLPAPVGDEDGMRVGFTRLALTCGGNLGNGTLDNEPEPTWPSDATPAGGDGFDEDKDGYTDEGCHVLGYWNIPVLLTGLSFENDPESQDSTGDCNTSPRVLKLNTLNKIEKFGSPLTMSAVYTHDGLLRNQDVFGNVDTWFDKPTDDEPDLPGFSMRLSSAYLNEITDPQNLPPWQGFTVLEGHVDVPLFNDALLKGHFINTGGSSLSLYMMEAGEDNDNDGIPAGNATGFDPNDNDPAVGDVTQFRSLLDTSESGTSPKPLFEYHWPGENMIDLVYRADFKQADDTTMPQFKGIKKKTDLAGVVSVDSIPDYINPERTRFSFGISANPSGLDNLFIDIDNIATGFLNTQLGEKLGVFNIDLEGMLAELTAAEDFMHDITGGDISGLLTEAIDLTLKEGLDQGGLADFIRNAANGLDRAHQAPYMVAGLLIEPFEWIQEEITSLSNDPDLDFSLLDVDIASADELKGALAPFLKYDPDALRTLYEDFTGITDDPAFDSLVSDYNDFQDRISELIGKLDLVNDAKADALAFVEGAAGGAQTNINEIIRLAYEASDLVHLLYGELTIGLGNYAVADMETNPLLKKLDVAKDGVGAVKSAIEKVHLGDIADALFIASIVAGSAMDVSMLHAAEETALSAVRQLDQTILDAEQNLTELLTSLPLSDILTTLYGFLGDGGLIQTSLRGAAWPGISTEDGLIPSLVSIRDTIPNQLAYIDADFNRVYDLVSSLVSSSQTLPDVATWALAVQSAQAELNDTFDALWIDMVTTGEASESLLFEELSKLSEVSVATVLVDQEIRQRIFTMPLQYITASGKALQADVKDLMENVTGLLPNPSEEDIRALIRSTILNTDQIEAMNRIFFEQLGFVSDIVDDVTTQIVHQINYMIREAIASINEGLQAELAGLTEDIGSGWGVAAAGIDGYAIVSQDEIERVHLEAEFSFAGDPDPTSYNAALDISTWNSDNGPGACTDGGTGGLDVVISTHDVSAEMLGMDVGLKEALLGFTLQTEPTLMPLGVFGRVYLQGELGFESMVLYDLGFETAFGASELYFAAKGAARFSSYEIPMAAFYLGKSCEENNVLARLDPEVADYIGEINPMTGVYVRGAAEVPIWNNGCALTVGVGADIGAWFFSEPYPGTYGGLLGGSAYGELACLASLKGAMSMIGQKSGSTYTFGGSGWGAAGVGYCSPRKWKSVRDARKDDWCLTGEATFGATYENSDWSFDGPDTSCCH